MDDSDNDEQRYSSCDWCQIAGRREQSGQTVAAKVAYNRALELDQENVEALYGLSRLCFDSPDESPLAVMYLETLLRIDSHHVSGLKLMTEHLVRVQQPFRCGALVGSLEDVALRERLRNEVEQGFSLEDERSQLHRGQFLFGLGELDKSTEVAESLLKSRTQSLGAYELLGKALIAKNGESSLPGAVALFRTALAIKGYPEEAYQGLRYALARIYEQLGDLNQAMRYFEDVYVTDVNYQDVADRLHRLRV